MERTKVLRGVIGIGGLILMVAGIKDVYSEQPADSADKTVAMLQEHPDQAEQIKQDITDYSSDQFSNGAFVVGGAAFMMVAATTGNKTARR